jgi:hypothetical protein
MFDWHAMRDQGFSNMIVRGMSPEEAPAAVLFFDHPPFGESSTGLPISSLGLRTVDALQ